MEESETKIQMTLSGESKNIMTPRRETTTLILFPQEEREGDKDPISVIWGAFMTPTKI